MLAPEDVFFSSYNQKMRREELFKLAWVKLEKQLSEVHKSEKNNVCSNNLGQKIKKNIFLHAILAP